MMLIYSAVTLLVSFGLPVAGDKICPPNAVNNTRSAFGMAHYAQLGVWLQVPCPTFITGEVVDRVGWFKEADSTTRLISRIKGEDYSTSDRYSFGTTGFSLVIKGIEETDEGKYLCQVIPRDTRDRTAEINIKVIGENFPASSFDETSTATIEQGRRQTLQCQCASQSAIAPSVVYWSMGEGVKTETDIIGARFSDGTTLQIQHGADYSIGSDASLAVNTLNNLRDSQQFWCHVFQPDSTLRNCIVDVRISGEKETNGNALRASETSYYLQKSMQQVLPCISWTPGDAACDVEWIKLGNPERQVVIYNLSTVVVDSSPAFNLTSDFGLVIQSPDDDHDGKYQCSVGERSKAVIEVRVIGDQFPLDSGSAIEGDPVTFRPHTRFTLHCPALSGIARTKGTLIWSYGSPDAQSTTVIGTFNLLDGSHTMNSLKNHSCLGVSTNRSLLLNNCSQDGDVRYWCHVFPANDNLIRSYVLIKVSDGEFETSLALVITLAIILVIFLVAASAIIVFLTWRQRSKSLHHKDDKERGDYKRLDKQDSIKELDVKTLATKVKSFVIQKFGKIPVTPWTDGDLACSAPIDTVYKPLRIFINAYVGGSCIKYQLDSESHIFSDGISELANEHVIVQGRAGSGKTTCLYRLLYDWANGREHAVFGCDRMVFLFTAKTFIRARSIGEAVVENMLQRDANISAVSIDKYYSKDKSKLTILIDGCNDKEDIDSVMDKLTHQDLLDCQLVLTTRQAELAEVVSKKHNMRHVTIIGFTLKSAIDYVNAVLDTVDERNKATPEHKPDKTKTKEPGSADVPQNKQSESQEREESVPLRQEKATPTEEKAETAQTQSPKKKRNLHKYLKEDILPPVISSLPAVLTALCQMSIWTKGDAFKPDVTMADLIIRVVKCLFDKNAHAKGNDTRVAITEGDQLDQLIKDQLNVLAELGRMAHPRLVESFKTLTDFDKEQFLKSSEKGEEVLKVASQIGLLCHLKVESKNDSIQQTTEAVLLQVSEVEVRKGCLCCPQKRHSETDQELQPTAELTPLNEPQDDRYCFVLEILHDLCVAMFLAQSVNKVNELFVIASIGERQYMERFAYILHFALQDKQFDRDAVVKHLAKMIEGEQARPNRGSLLQVAPRLQTLVEVSLQANFEGKCKGAINKKLKGVFREGRVRLIGISSYKLRLLAYLFEHATPENGSKLNATSVELFRIGKNEWSEIQECITSSKSKEKIKKLADLQTDKETSLVTITLQTDQENKPVAEVNQSGTDKYRSQKAQTRSEQPDPEAPARHFDKRNDKSLPTELSPEDTTSTNGDENCDDKNRQSSDVDAASYELIGGTKELALLKSLRERIESTNPDMPTFPAEQSDGSVLHTVQSMCLQELVESQGGECHTSGASRDLARYLPRLEMLESLVLVGTIFSSDAICDFAKGAHQLKNLKKLDLRLNKLFDDRAFVAVTNLPLRDCPKLSDLRLSLYKVTIAGFDEVKKEMDKNKGWPWGKLETLYLLHGSPAEKLLRFLSDSLNYFHFVKRFHLSATNQNENIQEDILQGFVKNMTTEKIMRNLKVLSIKNMEAVKERLASLKLPKNKGFGQQLKQLGTDLGLKRTSGRGDSDTKQKAKGNSKQNMVNSAVDEAEKKKGLENTVKQSETTVDLSTPNDAAKKAGETKEEPGSGNTVGQRVASGSSNGGTDTGESVGGSATGKTPTDGVGDPVVDTQGDTVRKTATRQKMENESAHPAADYTSNTIGKTADTQIKQSNDGDAMADNAGVDETTKAQVRATFML
ncbi:uncharacterized protein LOC110975472 [Acanthaster planci]|uniref:Uncharacterized protein LOC110975472 n=1 Tax=Acanthaster planci TaxID=133434 RepID=A0A8B7XUX2_ACAPL|nr:uncharacterized protein LOC110975472 [Acanthaster planci]